MAKKATHYVWAENATYRDAHVFCMKRLYSRATKRNPKVTRLATCTVYGRGLATGPS